MTEQLKREIVRMIDNADDRKIRLIYRYIVRLLGR